MADGIDRFDNEGGGGSFVMGLLTGTVLGAGLGILFAPKAGSELRSQLSDQAGNLANTASEGYRRASESAGEWADRGRGMYDKARDAVAKGADEAQQYVRETASSFSGSQPASSMPSPSAGGSGNSGSSYVSGSEGIRSASTYEPKSTGGSQPSGGSHSGGSGSTTPRRS